MHYVKKCLLLLYFSGVSAVVIRVYIKYTDRAGYVGVDAEMEMGALHSRDNSEGNNEVNNEENVQEVENIGPRRSGRVTSKPATYQS